MSLEHPTHQPPSESGLRGLFKSAVRRVLRPAVWDLQQAVARLESAVDELRRTNAARASRARAVWRGGLGGSAIGVDGSINQEATVKYRDELSYWAAAMHGLDPTLKDRFEETFGTWQQTRLNELADRLGLARDRAMDDWCGNTDVVEIGGGPIPCCAFRRFRSAAAIDPLAEGYLSAGLVPRWILERGIVHVPACGEAMPLAAASADLVIAENCLDHTDDPRHVASEIHRVLRPRGLLWLLVDLMDYRDHMHPSPMSEARLDALFAPLGFAYEYKDSWAGASHPMAKVQLRALLRKA